MNIIKILVICFSLLCSSVLAGDWSKTDTLTETGWQTINLIDCGQTLDIADKCRTTGIHERNPLLRRCPTFSEVNKHFIAGALLHFGVSYSLPKNQRAWFQWATITYGVSIVDSNMSLGLDIRF